MTSLYLLLLCLSCADASDVFSVAVHMYSNLQCIHNCAQEKISIFAVLDDGDHQHCNI